MQQANKGDLHRIWRFFGADEPNYAYMKDGMVAPGRKQYGELEAASNLATLGDAEQIAFDGGSGKLSFKLPRQGVSLVVLDFQ